MHPKPAEIISRTAAWRDRGISRETAIQTLGAQYHYRSLIDAARMYQPIPEHAGCTETATVIVDEIYKRKVDQTHEWRIWL